MNFVTLLLRFELVVIILGTLICRMLCSRWGEVAAVMFHKHRTFMLPFMIIRTPITWEGEEVNQSSNRTQ